MNPKAPSSSDIPNGIPFLVAAEGQERGHCTPHLSLGFEHSQQLPGTPSLPSKPQPVLSPFPLEFGFS